MGRSSPLILLPYSNAWLVRIKSGLPFRRRSEPFPFWNTIWNGQYVYYVDMILPHLRLAGTYDKACTDYQLWEIDQRVANYYYDITKRGFAQETVPQKIFSGAGYLPFSDGADLRRSKYRWL